MTISVIQDTLGHKDFSTTMDIYTDVTKELKQREFEDGEHILYVYGQYRGESNLGKLMHDFNCTKADDMNYNLMAERTRYLKENPKGVQEMCKAMEDMRNEAALAERKEIARTFILMGELSYEKIAKGTKLPIEEIEKMAGKEIRNNI